MPDEVRARLRRLRGDALEPSDALPRKRTDLQRHIGCGGGDRVVLGDVDVHDARRLRRPEAARERRAQRDRHLAEDRARHTLAEHPLDSVDDLDDLDVALEHDEERALLAFVHRVLTGGESDISARPREPLAVGCRERREQRDVCDLFACDHAPARA